VGTYRSAKKSSFLTARFSPNLEPQRLKPRLKEIAHRSAKALHPSEPKSGSLGTPALRHPKARSTQVRNCFLSAAKAAFLGTRNAALKGRSSTAKDDIHCEPNVRSEIVYGRRFFDRSAKDNNGNCSALCAELFFLSR
jgi:hypothetical protein